MITKDQYLKWQNKYTKDGKDKFAIDNKGNIQHLSSGNFLQFATFENNDLEVFKNWSEEEQALWLNGFWNFYLSIND